MPELILRIHDPSGSLSRDVRLQAGDVSTAAELVDAIVELFGWPRETIDGEPVRYGARRLNDAALLDEQAAVGTLGLVHGDALVLGPLATQNGAQ